MQRTIHRSLLALGVITTLLFGTVATTHADPVIPMISYGQAGTGMLHYWESFQTEDGRNVDAVVFAGYAGECAQVTMRSREVDAFLGIGSVARDGTVSLIAADDDSGGGTDARIQMYLPGTGDYLVLMSTLHPGESGRYSVELTRCLVAPPTAANQQRSPQAAASTPRPTGSAGSAPSSTSGLAEAWANQMFQRTMQINSDRIYNRGGWGRGGWSMR